MSSSPRGLFPPLMHTIDVYTESATSDRVGQVIESNKASNRKKKVMKKVQKKRLLAPLAKLGDVSIAESEQPSVILTPKRPHTPGRPQQPLPEDDYDDDRDNFDLLVDSAGSPIRGKPVTPSVLPPPKSSGGQLASPRAGRIYKASSSSARLMPEV